LQNLHRNRAGYDEALAQVIEHSQPNLIVCAGRMHILSPPFARRFADKVINLHPARPGMFPGMHSIAAAYQTFRRGETRRTGVMARYVAKGVDTGPVIATREVPIHPTDNPNDHAAEHELLVAAIRAVIENPRQGAEGHPLQLQPTTRAGDGETRTGLIMRAS
jgi:folate-dependent phosphoribosylglycinamide formyltransferase PurN